MLKKKSITFPASLPEEHFWVVFSSLVSEIRRGHFDHSHCEVSEKEKKAEIFSKISWFQELNL